MVIMSSFDTMHALGHPDKNGNTTLHHAILNSNPYEIESNLKYNAALIHVQNKWGRTPLWYAAKKRNTTAIKQLVEHGADINQVDYRLYSPLAMCIPWCDLELVEWFVENGSDTTPQWEPGEECRSDLMIIACTWRKWRTACYLLEFNYKLPDDPKYQWSLMEQCVRSTYLPDYDDLTNGFLRYDILEQLFADHNFDPNHVNPYDNQTLLHIAAKYGDMDAAKTLITAGANFKAKNAKGLTPLCLARRARLTEMIELLDSLHSVKRAE